jgi:hypothetical protein
VGLISDTVDRQSIPDKSATARFMHAFGAPDDIVQVEFGA